MLAGQMEEARRNSRSQLLEEDNVSRAMQMIGTKVKKRRRAANIVKSHLHLLHLPLSSLAWWSSLNLFPLLGFSLQNFEILGNLRHSTVSSLMQVGPG